MDKIHTVLRVSCDESNGADAVRFLNSREEE